MNLFLVPIGIVFLFDQWEILKIGILVLLFFQAVLVNFLFQKHKLNTDSNQFSGLFTFLLGCILLLFDVSWKVPVANSLALLTLAIILNCDKPGQIAGRLLNAGLLLGITILIFPPSIMLILVVFYGLNRIRAYKFKERLQFLTGIATVFIHFFLYHYLTDQKINFYEFISLGFIGWIQPINVLSWTTWIALSIFLILVLLSYPIYISKKSLLIQKKIGIFYVWTWIAIPMLFLTVPFQFEHLFLISMPVGILIGQNFYFWPKWWGEVIFWLLVLGSLFFNLNSSLYEIWRSGFSWLQLR
jgi:hypothetical protein